MFHALGVGKDDVVSFMLPLVPDAFVTLFGAEAAGIANPVNPLLEPHQIAEILRSRATPRCWWRSARCRAPTSGRRSSRSAAQLQAPARRSCRSCGGRRSRATASIAFDELIKQQPSDRLVSGRKISGGDIAAYFHTGGTTGTPKLVRHTHANQVYQAWALNLLLQVEAGRATCCSACRCSTSAASLTQALRTLSAGGCAGRAVAARLAQSECGQEHLAPGRALQARGAVAACRRCWRQRSSVPPGNADISSLKLPPAAARRFRCAVGKAIQEQAQAAGARGLRHDRDLERAHASPIRTGRSGSARSACRCPTAACASSSSTPMAASMRDCAPDEIGVVSMAGPGVFGGYLNDVHNKGAFVEPGWVNSGDLGRLDADGYLWITGRAKDLVIRGGHNIDPGADRGDHVPASGGRARRRGRPARRLCRRAAGRLRAAEAGRERRAGRAGSLGARAHAGARRGAGAGHSDRSDAAHRRRQGVQAAAALGRRAARVREACWRRSPSAASTARSRSAPMAATAASPP